jgi:hypothetical protein
MIRFLVLLAALLLGACDVGPFPKDPTTAPSSWPADPLPPFAAAGASSGCAGAIENSKRLGCPFEADDAGGWCTTRSAKEVTCMTSAKACLALRQCTEVSK